MAELKTKKTKASVDDFLARFPEGTRKNCLEISKMMKAATQAEPKMWGSSIIGFGDVRQRYASGRELDWMRIGFSPRKQNLTLYLHGFADNEPLLSKLGKFTMGKGCLHFKRLSDVDRSVLNKLIAESAVAILQSAAKSAC